VDSEGEVLDLLVQPRRDKAAAMKLMRKKEGYAPTVLVTDKAAILWGREDRDRHDGPS